MSWRPRFHLSTALIVMLAAGALLFLNLRHQRFLNFEANTDPSKSPFSMLRMGKFGEDGANYEVAMVPLDCAHGWPWQCHRYTRTFITRRVDSTAGPVELQRAFHDFPRDTERADYDSAIAFRGGKFRTGMLIADVAVALAIVLTVGIVSEWLIGQRKRAA